MGRLVDGVKWGLDPDELFIDRAHLKFMGLGLLISPIFSENSYEFRSYSRRYGMG